MTFFHPNPLPPALFVGLVFAALFFTAALVTGIWKWRAMLAAENGEAHRYVDVAHHAALHYGPFITLAGVLALFWPFGEYLPAEAFVAAMGVSMSGSLSRYVVLGIRGGVANQLRQADRTSRVGLILFLFGSGMPGLALGLGALGSLLV